LGGLPNLLYSCTVIIPLLELVKAGYNRHLSSKARQSKNRLMKQKNDLSGEIPLVTIGVTCFNAQDTIERALESARSQHWPRLEIIVVDDASEDAGVERIQKIAETDNRIKLICHDRNKGYPAALNTITENAKGEFIAFFDDDDESSPDRVEKQCHRLIEYEERSSFSLVFCYSNRRVMVNGKEKPEGFVRAIGRNAPEPQGHVVADYLLLHKEEPKYVWGQFGSCTLMARRSMLQSVGGFDETFRRSAEWDFSIRAAFKGAHFIAVDQPLVIQHKTPTTDKSGKIPLKYALQLRKKYKTYLKKQHSYLASIALACSRFYYSRGRRWRSRLYLVLACLCSPFFVFPSELAKRFRSKNPIRTEN
jgi:glycosyltransferase involved in cell wall biosynthesis